MASAPDWWLAAEERVFGPYTHAQLEGFLNRGRLATSSRMGRSHEGPFASAGDWPELAALFRRSPSAPAQADPSAERALIVLASLRETSIEALHAALSTHGTIVRVRGTLWACRARLPASGLRNAVSRRLAPGEFLFVAETDGAAAAWFNLDPEVDRALRKLWSGEARRVEVAGGPHQASSGAAASEAPGAR